MAKFCQYCGTEVKAEEKKEEKKTATKTVEKKAEVKQENVNKAPVQNQGNKGLAIASMVLGIISIIFCWCGLWAGIFPLLGFIFALCSKSKSGFKIAGLITSIVGFVLQLFITIIAVVFLGALSSVYDHLRYGDYDDIIEKYEDKIDDYYDDDDYTFKYASVYGEWTCTPYPASDYTNDEETTLNFKYTGTYIYGPSDDLDNNYYKGSFTYEREYDKNEKYTDREFIKVTAPITEFKMNGINQSIENKNLNLEMEFINDYDEAIIMFDNTSNTYLCEK